MSINFATSSCRSWGLALCAAGALLGASVASGQSAASQYQKQFERERAVCLNGQSHQDRSTCLKEAAAAYQEARRGSLGNSQEAALEENRRLRCKAQAPEDQSNCLRRVSGEGMVSGSVTGGGIFRELTTVVPATN